MNLSDDYFDYFDKIVISSLKDIINARNILKDYKSIPLGWVA